MAADQGPGTLTKDFHDPSAKTCAPTQARGPVTRTPCASARQGIPDPRAYAESMAADQGPGTLTKDFHDPENEGDGATARCAPKKPTGR